MQNDEVNVFRRINWAIQAALASVKSDSARWQINGMEVHSAGYAEPGCSDPESGAVVLGNWNNITKYDEETGSFKTVDDTPKRLAEIFEKLGADIHWSDCWTTCNECCALVQTEPDCYSWSPSYVIMGGGIWCHDCLDAEEYLESIEDTGQVNSIFDPSDHDYVLVESDFERGLHRGQDADPEIIGKLMRGAGFSRWILNLESKGQFDVSFSLWLHEEEAEKNDGEGIILAKRIIEQGNTDGPSVAGAMERGLKEVSRQSEQLRKEGATGILVSKIGMDGTTTKEISNQDFVDGKGLD